MFHWSLPDDVAPAWQPGNANLEPRFAGMKQRLETSKAPLQNVIDRLSKKEARVWLNNNSKPDNCINFIMQNAITFHN
jgi:hypothetical protein